MSNDSYLKGCKVWFIATDPDITEYYSIHGNVDSAASMYKKYGLKPPWKVYAAIVTTYDEVNLD